MPDSLSALLFDACGSFGSARACQDENGLITYSDFAARADEVANALRRRDMQKDEPVLAPVSNQGSDLVAFMGIWRAGGVVVPVHRSTPPAAIEHTRVTTGARLLADGAADTLVREIGPECPLPRKMLSGAALIIFTSGSTGQPKGVVLSHRAFAGKLQAIDSLLRFSRSTRSLLVLQITFSFGIWVSLLTLIKGGVLLLRPRFEPEGILRAIAAEGATDAALVPTMLRRFLSLDGTILLPLIEAIGLERIISGGEPLGRELSRQVRELLPKTGVADVYGLTETCTSDFILLPDEQEAFAGSIGRPTPGVSFRIADDQGRTLSPNQVGELQIRTPFLMSGYLDQPELTRAAFCEDFLRTGDLARVQPDGMVELVGRSKELIVRGGTKVSPLELDQLLAKHPGVAVALTVGIPDPVFGERIHALIVLREHTSLEESELRRWVAERVEKFKQPDVYHFDSMLPTGRTGKVDRGALRQLISKMAAPETG
jgi:long-chain acyl-CoA synthetase